MDDEKNYFDYTDAVLNGTLNMTDPDWDPSDLTAKHLFLSIICAVGLIGNIMSIFVIVVLKEYKKSTLHLYVLQLAIADTMFLCGLPFLIKQDQANEWVFSEAACKMRESIVFLNYYASVFFLMIMSVDRYLAVCHSFSPQLTKLRKPFTAGIIIAVTWILCFIACIPSILYAKVIGMKGSCRCSYEFPCDGPTCTPAKCQTHAEFYGDYDENDYENETLYDDEVSYEEYYDALTKDGAQQPDHSLQEGCHYGNQPTSWYTFIYINFTLLFVLPVIVMVITYGFIIQRLRKTEARTVKQRSSSRTSTTAELTRRASTLTGSTKGVGRPGMSVNKRVTIMCSTLVASFIVLWLPFHAIHLAKLRGIKGVGSKICVHLTAASTVMGYLNSALNPYFYSFIGTNFTRRFRLARRTLRKSVHSGTENSRGGRTVIFTKGKGSESGAYNITLMTREHRSAGDIKKSENSTQ